MHITEEQSVIWIIIWNIRGERMTKHPTGKYKKIQY